MNGKTLMQRLLAAGCSREDMDTHYSDLYVPVNSLTSAVIDEWCKENAYEKDWFCPKFTDNITKKPMYDCAFANDDYWRQDYRTEIELTKI